MAATPAPRYTHDFIELYNRGTTTIDLTGWSVQYASTTGTTWQVTTLSGTLAPGQYYLVQQAAGAGGTTPLPTPDASGSIAMSATNGKVALANTATPLTGSCSTAVVDLVGYGSANCFEGAGAAPTLSNTTAAIRRREWRDTNSNWADFTTGAPNPRNGSYGVDFAPNVASTSPVNGALGALIGANIVIDFSEAVTVSGSWFDITCTSSGVTPRR